MSISHRKPPSLQAARAARRFPVLFSALAEGRLHLTAVSLLAPYLTPEKADELIQEAAHKRKLEIEELLARRFPPPEAPARVRAVTPVMSELPRHAPAHVGTEPSPAIGTHEEHAPGHVEYPQVEMPQHHSPERFLVQVTIEKGTRAANDSANAKLVGETARVVVSGWGDHYRRDAGEDVAGREEAS